MTRGRRTNEEGAPSTCLRRTTVLRCDGESVDGTRGGEGGGVDVDAGRKTDGLGAGDRRGSVGAASKCALRGVDASNAQRVNTARRRTLSCEIQKATKTPYADADLQPCETAKGRRTLSAGS